MVVWECEPEFDEHPEIEEQFDEEAKEWYKIIPDHDDIFFPDYPFPDPVYQAQYAYACGYFD